MERSVWQTAVAATRTSAAPRPGRGVGRSATSKRRGAWRTAVRIMSLGGSSPDGPSGDDRDFFHREVTDDLRPIRVDNQHLLDPHPPLVSFAVLGLQREDHARPDLERVVERPDARDHRLVVLGEAEAVTPEVRGGLVILGVAPRFPRRRPLERDVAGRGAGTHRVDGIVELLERGGVVALHLLRPLLAHAAGPGVARLAAVPRERREG